MKELQYQLSIVLKKIKVLQRHIRLCNRVIRSATRQKTKDQAEADKENALSELYILELDRDQIRDEIENLLF
jgi:hypothetical protein